MTENAGGDGDGGPAPTDGRSDLDLWLQARVSQVVRDATESLESYDACRTTQVLEGFVEDLSNWYVRRSRRRFWAGETAALDTLYVSFVTLLQVLAPLIPFTTEAMYRNLVARRFVASPESVHHTRWPVAPEATESDEQLLREMALVMHLAALGRSARATSNVKLRQPLGRATVAVRTEDEESAVRRLGAHLASELNVKTLDVVRDEGSLFTYAVRPVLPKLGPKYGKLVPGIRRALADVDAADIARRVMDGETVELTVEGRPIVLLADEVEVMAAAREGLATAEEAGYAVAIETAITDELRAEGLARDLVRRVQQLRKDSGLDISDRIHLGVQAPGDVAGAIEAWREYVCGETLAVTLTLGPLGADLPHTATDEIDGRSVIVGLRRS